MKKRIISLVLLGTILVSLLAAGIVAGKRMISEGQNRQVEMSVEYGQVMELARQSGLSYEEILENMQHVGVTGILFKEQTILELQGQLWTALGGELLASSVLTPEQKKQVRPEYTYLLTMDEQIHKRIAKQLAIKVPTAQVLAGGPSPYGVGSALTAKQLELIGLGFPEEDMRIAENMGFNLQVQIRSWPQVEDGDLEAYFSSLAQFKNLTLILFNDKTIPGFPGKYLLLAEEIKKLNVPIGLIEFYGQKGFNRLAVALDKNVVRLHSISPNLMAGMAPRTAIDRYTLAVTDRNIRAILVRFFMKEESGNWVEDNVTYIGKVRDSLVSQGYTLGRPNTLVGPAYSGFLTLLVGLGVIAGGVLLLNILGLELPGLVLGALAGLGWLGLLLTGHGLMGRKLMALAAVVVFPSLGVLSGLKGEKTDLKGSIILLIRTSFISLCGALLLVGLLSELTFMLKLDQFSGVKLAHVAPLVIIAFTVVVLSEKKDTLKTILGFLNSNITVWYALVAGIMAVALLVYVMRTGNEAPAVSTLELQLRGWLNRVLLVRPRTKEFLIGHPLMLLILYFGYKHHLLPVLLLGAIGQISMVNTFAHIHTPLLVSLVRVFNGLWLGTIIGVLLILLCRAVQKAGRRIIDGQ